jgi:hypothetical protein
MSDTNSDVRPADLQTSRDVADQVADALGYQSCSASCAPTRHCAEQDGIDYQSVVAKVEDASS